MENVVHVSCKIIVYCFTLCRKPCPEKFQAKSGPQKEIRMLGKLHQYHIEPV